VASQLNWDPGRRAYPLKAGVIGWPIHHSKSPAIHQFWLSRLGLEGAYLRIPTPPNRLAEIIDCCRAAGFVGINITAPHKEAAAKLPLLQPYAWLGPINTVLFDVEDSQHEMESFNTDVSGAVEVLGREQLPPEALVIGAGGAAHSIILALEQLGIRQISVMNRNQDRARALVRHFEKTRQQEIEDLRSERTVSWSVDGLPPEIPQLTFRTLALESRLPSVPLVVNASAIGMGSNEFPFDLSDLPANSLVFDLVYSPLETQLLAEARARGHRIIDGLSMLIAQADPAFGMFFGHAAPREHDVELRELLTQ
jgi:shikimate dehydrogenase